MYVLLTPKGKWKINEQGEKIKWIHLKGYIENPQEYMLKAYFKENYKDIIQNLRVINIAHKVKCEVMYKNSGYDIYVLKTNNKYFVYSDRYNELKIYCNVYMMKEISKKILKEIKEKKIRLDNRDFKLLKKIQEVKNIKELKQIEIKKFLTLKETYII